MNILLTRVILLYLEEVTDGRALMDAARRIITKQGKPVLLLKSGRTREGASAAASPGSLAGADAISDAAFRQAGIIRCDTVEEMFNFAAALHISRPRSRSMMHQWGVRRSTSGSPSIALKRALRKGVFHEDHYS